MNKLGLLLLGLTLTAAPLVAVEPANLDVAKAAVRKYLKSGDYDRDLAAAARPAVTWLEQRAKQGGTHLTVVFDLDETLLSNLPLMQRQDFGYVPTAWTAWVAEGAAPAIEPVREIYLVARKLGFDVVFLSGRRERDRAGTEKNLREIGCGDYATLILKPNDSQETTGAFKLAHRRRLAAGGHTIVANLGDQASDFAGGESERNFKLPCPFYLTE